MWRALTMSDVFRGSSGASPIKRRSTLLIATGGCIRDRGTGHTIADGRCCGSTLSWCVNPSSLRAHSHSRPPNTRPQLLTLTSDIFSRQTSLRLASLPRIDSKCTPSHSQWTSNALLHVSWANRAPLAFEEIVWSISLILPLDAMLNRLLAWCTFLGSPIEKEVENPRQIVRHLLFLPSELLTPLVASDRLVQILRRLSKAIISTIDTAQPRGQLVEGVLSDLRKLGTRPWCLTEMTYEWCSVIYESRRGCEDKRLLSRALEAGVRHLDSQDRWIPDSLAHTEHHRKLVRVIFQRR